MRVERLNSVIRQEIAGMLQKELRDQVSGLVSIVEVETARDLSVAKVYYSVIGSDKDKAKSRRALTNAASFVKGRIGRVIKLRTIPDLLFIYDESLERGSDLLEKIKNLD